jgi:vacuolar-type H+-ATPase subunit E/Vma4
MQNTLVEKSALIAGIENDAQAQADKIVNEALKHAQERKKFVELQVASIIKEAEERATQKYESIKRTILAGAKVEVNRKSMEIRKKVMEFIDEHVRVEFKAMLKEAGYKKMLLNWVVEASVGLDAAIQTVNASAEERALIDAGFLKQAEEQVKKAGGQDVKLTLSSQPPLTGQGIIVTAVDGRTAFNNQVVMRLRRKQKEIDNLIFERLFTKQG